MQRFKFPLEKVLQYRGRVLEAEQARLSGALARLQAVQTQLANLIEMRRTEQSRLQQSGSIEARELANLAAFLQGAAVREKQLRAEVETATRAADQQREAVLKARREHRLVERLRERRKTEWQQAFDKELQQTAEENFLARWKEA